MARAIVTPLQGQLPIGALWQPSIGPEGETLVQRKLPEDARAAVLDSSCSILSKAVPPTASGGSTTGLVVGYVQSGKTLSFTTVMALARDNGFQLVIVVAGTSKPLLEQSTRRVRQDLRIDDIEGPPRWKLYTNPTNSENARRNIQQTINDWRDDDVPPNERATVLVTVMKQHRHLKNLVGLLGRLQLDGVPALIVDDEADQASLNTLVTRGQQSTTYSRLLELRDSLPNHTYLQYTATPQAPLLVNIIDALSPSFVEVLDPGSEYVGGKAFFTELPILHRVIPPEEIPTDDYPLDDPPETLLAALRVFLVGVAAGWAEGRSARNANRSMLVHPSQRTEFHKDYRRWIGEVFDEWQRVLELPEADSDRQDLLEGFEEAHAELSTTVDTLPAFDELAPRLARAFRVTRIEEVNARAGQTPIVDFTQSYGWILVGGQAMDRGFTVEGLTVTYMPRGPGVGNADTIQQRGRFLGYKRRYLGYCRVYLEQDAIDAFVAYVEHEEFMRDQLQKIRRSGNQLREWKRAFVLSPDLKPCRHNVLEHDYIRGKYNDSWFSPSVAQAPTAVIEENRSVVDAFLQEVPFNSVTTDEGRELAQRHRLARGIPLAKAMAELVVPFRVTGATDSSNLIGAMLQLSAAIDVATKDGLTEFCTIYEMSPDFNRQRAIDAEGRINELFQGPTRLANGTYSYPGDGAFRDQDTVTIQIHRLALKREGHVVAENVPVLAIWIPHRLAIDWIAQGQVGGPVN